MTQQEFNRNFRQTYPHFQVMTLTDRRLYYNDLMEIYYRDGVITEKQRQTWGHPKFLTTNRGKINCSAY